VQQNVQKGKGSETMVRVQSKDGSPGLNQQAERQLGKSGW
jgi:hypothetical protein